MLRRLGVAALLCLATTPTFARAESDVAEKAPPAQADADGWPDLSGFLDEKYGFLPIVIPITEPAVGYGAVGGVMFICKPLGAAAQGLGRPNITFVGGFGTRTARGASCRRHALLARRLRCRRWPAPSTPR